MMLSFSPFVHSFIKEFLFWAKSYNGVSRKFKGGFNEVSRIFHESFKDRKFLG